MSSLLLPVTVALSFHAMNPRAESTTSSSSSSSCRARRSRGNSLLVVLQVLHAAQNTSGGCFCVDPASSIENFRRRGGCGRTTRPLDFSTAGGGCRCPNDEIPRRPLFFAAIDDETETRSKSKSTTRRQRRRGGEKKEEEEKESRRKKLQRLKHRRRLDRWTRRYGSADALRSTFGAALTPWGDLSPRRTRALYHSLLPRSLVALNEMGLMRPEELAPLAYEARMAAKEYARSRCVWTGRVGTYLFDQYRSVRDRGRLVWPGSSASMSWEEIWDKYEARIVLEECEGELALKDDDKKREKRKGKNQDQDLATRIYMRILEKSCETNQAFDSLFLAEYGSEDGDLAAIASQLDNDVREILLPPKERTKLTKMAEKTKRRQQKALDKEEKRQRKVEERERKAKRKERRSGKNEAEGDEEFLEHEGTTAPADECAGDSDIQQKSRRYEALRTLAGTRRWFRRLLDRQK